MRVPPIKFEDLGLRPAQVFEKHNNLYARLRIDLAAQLARLARQWIKEQTSQTSQYFLN